MISSRIEEGKKLLDEEKRLIKHREFKKILSDLTGSDPHGAILHELKTTQIAALCCPESVDNQKLITHALSPFKIKKLDSFELIEAGFLDIMTELKLPIPDVLRWWISSDMPKNVPIEEAQNTTAPPAQQDVKPKEKTSIYQLRDDDFLAWVESENVLLDNMTMTKAQIHESLKKRNGQLWSHGFDDWNRQQPFFKLTSGRKHDVHRKAKPL